jgi:tetratricopeptide (TPR) repeat protein
MSGMANPSYPGNASLPREVRDKILSTFRHTLNLFKEGKLDDCVIGCDFILKMDTRFTPARQLMEKAKNPAADVDVAALEAVVAETPTRQERVASVETDRLLVRAAESFNARDFDAAIAAADQVLQVLPGNHNASEIAEKARQKQRAAPQFEVARQRAIAALDGQRMGEAKSALEKMRSLDAEHPAVTLLERRLSTPASPPAREVGESTNPGFASPRLGDENLASASELDNLSLDSLSLDEPLDPSAYVPTPSSHDEPHTGPLSLSGEEFSRSLQDAAFSTHEAGAPPNLWSDAPSALGDLALEEPPAGEYTPASSYSAEPTPAAEPELPSPESEIAALIAQGDEASRTGNRQQAIELWSRIFLIDINNSEAVGRIEKARQEMAEGNRKVTENLKRGRERFEAGDFSAAREAFLQVLAVDETDATARTQLDRIEQELARPSSGLDLSKKSPQSDILAEEMAADAAEADAVEIAEHKPREKEKAQDARPKAPRRPIDKRFVMALGGSLVLATARSPRRWQSCARSAPTHPTTRGHRSSSRR